MTRAGGKPAEVEWKQCLTPLSDRLKVIGFTRGAISHAKVVCADLGQSSAKVMVPGMTTSPGKTSLQLIVGFLAATSCSARVFIVEVCMAALATEKVRCRRGTDSLRVPSLPPLWMETMREVGTAVRRRGGSCWMKRART